MVATTSIVSLSPETAAAILKVDGGNGWKNKRSTWERIAHEHEQGARTTMVAVRGSAVVAYGSLLWQSAYSAFARAGIPEIHDVAVAHEFRGQGVATHLISEFERLAGARGCVAIGLGVGLYGDYGAAQRLYARLGYLPDGLGVTYRNRQVSPGALVPVDDDLVLWMNKVLSSQG